LRRTLTTGRDEVRAHVARGTGPRLSRVPSMPPSEGLGIGADRSTIARVTQPSAARTDARERVLTAAADLMARRGIRDVELREVASHARVSARELHELFPTKQLLAEAFLQRREEEWTVGFVEAGARLRGGDSPTDRLLAIFDVFHDWFQRDDFEACSFINVLIEMGREHPLGIASREYLANIRALVQRLATEADLEHPEAFASSWHILMKGSIISAVEGDTDAAMRAQSMARDLIARHRRPSIEDEIEQSLDRWTSGSATASRTSTIGSSDPSLPRSTGGSEDSRREPSAGNDRWCARGDLNPHTLASTGT
jgi:AcrR family transcriptional regulator